MSRTVHQEPDPLLGATTLNVVERSGAAPGEALPALSILYHPDARRVGQVARLDGLRAGRFVPLSRVEPPFGPPGEVAREALADPFLSRRPVTLGRSEDRFVLVANSEGSPVIADGSPVTGTCEWSPDALARGVVLELGGRVVLLLHLVDPETNPGGVSRAPRLGLVGDSDAIERLRGDILRVADLDVSVLVRGETGTGKELVARAIHAASRRRDGPCVCVNMATVTDSVAASELFGHARGAFTGAVRDAPGYFTRADGGTLFLDEVGATPAAVQAMLLRVLETREVQPVGASSSRRVDVRLIAATDADLEACVHDGRFGAALLHRLASYEIVLAPLRARRDDLGRLFFHFLREELAALGESARLDGSPADPRPWVPPSLVARLARHDWPGNVRQLRNVVRQLVISSRGEERLQVGAPVERLLAAVAPGVSPAVPAVAQASAASRRKPSQIPDKDLLAALRANDWKREPTARQLGIAVSSLYVLIDRCALLRKANEIPREELERCRTECDGDLERMAARLEVSARGLQLRMRELGLA